MKKSTIYLNKHNYKDIKIVLLIFKSSDKIITRIKANDWIKYSTEIGAYMVRYSERNIGLLKDIFRDIAEVNTYYLERKRINPKAIEINIGNNFGKYSKLKLKRDLHNVRLFPFKIGNISYLQLQYKKNYKINRELELSSVCRWSKDLSTFILPAKKASILRLLKELDKLARIQIHSSLKISDAKIMQQLYEQSYIKNLTYIACPVEYISFMLSRNYSINTIRTYHNLLLRFLNSFKANTINQINNFNTNTINRYFQLLNQS
ncbi:MAG: site-specific integrase, partial [Bacteroidota bacterium]|nr:site-specific integrase [Bacteroidota bacterium]